MPQKANVFFEFFAAHSRLQLQYTHVCSCITPAPQAAGRCLTHLLHWRAWLWCCASQGLLRSGCRVLLCLTGSFVADGEDLSAASKPRQWVAAVYYVTATITTARARLTMTFSSALPCPPFCLICSLREQGPRSSCGPATL